MGLIPQLGRFSWRRAWRPTSVFLAEQSNGQGSLVGYSPWVTELDMTEVTAHVCTEQTFSEVSLCSTASSLLPSRSSVRQWQWGRVSILSPPSVSTGALVFLPRNKKSLYRKKPVSQAVYLSFCGQEIISQALRGRQSAEFCEG